MALQVVELSFPEDTVAQSGAFIFAHAPQYHWHASGTGGIDEEAREHLVALEALVDRFGCQTENHEEVLASRIDAEGATGIGIGRGLGGPRSLDWRGGEHLRDSDRAAREGQHARCCIEELGA